MQLSSKWRLAAGGFASGLLCASLAAVVIVKLQPTTNIDSELIAGHVRSLQVDHLTDVASTDQHTVKPWFQGRIDYTPPVEDFTPEGFPLIGGRLDYLAGRPVAVLVYQHNRHIINVFMKPVESGVGRAFEVKRSTMNGFNIVHWSDRAIHASMVSDLNPDELRMFERLLKERLRAGS